MRTAVAVVLLLVFPLSLVAQQQPFGEQMNVTAIEVTAEVVDAHGRTPGDLQPSDFVIIEDGVERPVKAVEYLSGATGAATINGTQVVEAAPVAEPAAAPKPTPEVTTAAKPWDILIYIDFDLSGRRTIRDAVRALAAQAPRMAKTGRVEVVVADPSPRRLLEPSNDPDAIAKALTLTEVLNPADRLTHIRKQFLENLNDKIARKDEPKFAGLNDTRMPISEEGMLIRNFLDRLGTYIGGYHRDGTRALFLVSDGYDVDPSDFYAPTLPPPAGASALDVRAKVALDRTASDSPRNTERMKNAGLATKGGADMYMSGEALQTNRRSFDEFAQQAAAGGWTIVSLRGGLSGNVTDDATVRAGQRATNFGSQAPVTGRPNGTINVRDKEPLNGMADATGGAVETVPSHFFRAIDSLSNRVKLTYTVSRAADPHIRHVDVRVRRPGLTVNAAKWASSSTPEYIAARRASELVAGNNVRGELPLVAKLSLQDSSRRAIDQGVLETRVSLAALESMRPMLTSSTLRLTIAASTGDDRPAIQHQLLTGYDLSKMKQVTIAIPMQIAERAKSVAVVVEELISGAWGGTALAIDHTDRTKTAFVSSGWTDQPVEAMAFTPWSEALRQAQAEKKLIVAAPSACADCDKLFDSGVVRSRLGGYVVTRLDAPASQALGLAGDGHVVLLDQWGRLRFDWNTPSAQELTVRLAQARTVAGNILRAGDLLQTGESAEAHFALGFAYLRTDAFTKAKSEYDAARTLASQSGDGILAQRADIQSAAVTAQSGQRREAIASLEKIVRTPASATTEAEAWLVLGHLRKSGGDPRAAQEAYVRAAQRAPQGSELRRIASSLAGPALRAN